MNAIHVLLLIAIAILLIWDVFLHFSFRKQNNNRGKKYLELNSRLNFIIAFGSLAILIITYLGLDVKSEILEKANEPISEMVNEKKAEIDSLLENKNILKAGIYIVTNLEFKENKVFRFKDLLTIDNKHIPELSSPPKLLITTTTGENLRIDKITTEYFVLGFPIQKNFSLLNEAGDPKYPSVLKFDVWIADYSPK